MRLKTQNGIFLIFSSVYGHAVYYKTKEGYENYPEGNYPGKILKVLPKGELEFNQAQNNWGVESKPLTQEENLLLERTAPFRLKIQKLAIKNPKGESSILRESSFFKLKESDLTLVSRAHGGTYRKVHQGTNGWNLFNVEGYQMPLTEKPNSTLVNFGTYSGQENNLGMRIYEEDLVPISIEEWEKITGRPFNLANEFSWFKGHVERQYGEDKISSQIRAQMEGYNTYTLCGIKYNFVERKIIHTPNFILESEMQGNQKEEIKKLLSSLSIPFEEGWYYKASSYKHCFSLQKREYSVLNYLTSGLLSTNTNIIKGVLHVFLGKVISTKKCIKIEDGLDPLFEGDLKIEDKLDMRLVEKYEDKILNKLGLQNNEDLLIFIQERGGEICFRVLEGELGDLIEKDIENKESPKHIKRRGVGFGERRRPNN